MKVIQFVLNNWFVIIVIYFILSSLIKRSRGGAKAPSSKPSGRGMPSFGGGGSGTGWEKKSPVMSKGKPPGAPAPEAPAKKMEQPESRPSLADSSSNSARSFQERPWSGSPAESAPVHSSALAQGKRRPSADQLAQGILWAEILGPPRSKKPYRK